MDLKITQTFTTTPGMRATVSGVFIVREREATIDEMTLAEYADYHRRTHGDDTVDTGDDA